MNFKVLFIYSISFLLLSIFLNSTRKDNSKTNNGIINHYFFHKKVTLRRSFINAGHAQLLLAYTIGDKKGLPYKIKKIHKNLCLMHLFTPSGLHLSSILMLLGPLFYLSGRTHPKMRAALPIIFLIPTFFLPGFFSIKRMALLRGLKSLSQILKFPIPLWWLFIISFIIDFFIGSFRSSPLSFCYSFLFLGIIISLHNGPKWKIPIGIMGGQVLLSFLSITKLNLIGVLIGIMATSVFTLFFPLFFLFLLLERYLPYFIGEFLIKAYLKFLTYLSSLADLTPSISISLYIVLCFLVYFAISHKAIRIILITVFLSLHFLLA